jgi:hypothetical protein
VPSTGGFTGCLLQRGAAHVTYGVGVGQANAFVEFEKEVAPCISTDDLAGRASVTISLKRARDILRDMGVSGLPGRMSTHRSDVSSP